MWRRLKYSGIIIVILIVSFLPSCSPSNMVTKKGLYLGTFLTFSIDSAHSYVYSKVSKILNNIDRKFSRFNKESFVYRINNKKGEWIKVDKEFIDVLKFSIHMNEISYGAFNPILGEVESAWGFYDGNYRVPSEEELKELRNGTNIKNIMIDEERERVKIIDGELDFGGLVKGYALDSIKNLLEKEKVKRCVVNLGGNILVFGDKKEGFKIGIRHPRGSDIIAKIRIFSGTVATSGDYENYFIKDGVRYHHIIDPSTLKPAKSGVIEVTVISEDGMLGDALSTTLFVLGIERGEEFLKEKYPQVKAIIIDEGLNKHFINGAMDLTVP